MTKYKVGIAGSAGRKEDAEKLDRHIWLKMRDKVMDYLDNNIPEDYDQVCLISGGAAWSDHLAVSIFNSGYSFGKTKPCDLVLCLPCYFRSAEFDTSRGTANQRKTAHTANYYHDKFEEKTGEHSLQQIYIALQNGAHQMVRDGFFERNKEVAKLATDLLLAFTFKQGNEPKQGGTLHTWRMSRAKERKHFNIGLL